MLPLLYSLHASGVNAEYDHEVSARGVRGFAEAYLPDGVSSYRQAIRALALELYAGAAPGKTHFLDKTPRYHHVADELIELFPEGRFVFLWRNPLAVAASFMETWGHGRWNLDGLSADLFRGLPHLVATYTRHAACAVSIRYEDLVTRPDEEILRILRYLGVSLDDGLVNRFSALPMKNLKFWDPQSAARMQVTSASVATWKRTMANPLRKIWCRRYIDWLGAELLAVMGYEHDKLLADLATIPLSTRHLGSDILLAARGVQRRRQRAVLLGTTFPLWRAPSKSSS
jgi:hypothetical protein